MGVMLTLVSVLVPLVSTPKCVPNPGELPPFDSTQVAHLVGQFQITFVDTTKTPPLNSGTQNTSR